MDGHRLHNRLEVYTATDPFYPVFIINSKLHCRMSQVRGRRKSDRRKKHKRDEFDHNLFVDQTMAFQLAVKNLDEESKNMVCHLCDAQKISERRKEERLELLDGWAMVINKKNPHSIQYVMTSKKFKR